MPDWLLWATRWRSDGTPYPDRRLVSALENGDPLAYLYLAAAILAIVAPAIYRALTRR
jgi:hypothetical protein